MDLFKPAPLAPLPELLKAARLKSGLSPDDVTTKINATSLDLYPEWEEGKRVPGNKWLPRLAKVLTIRSEDLREAAEAARAAKKGASDE